MVPCKEAAELDEEVVPLALSLSHSQDVWLGDEPPSSPGTGPLWRSVCPGSTSVRCGGTAGQRPCQQ